MISMADTPARLEAISSWAPYGINPCTTQEKVSSRLAVRRAGMPKRSEIFRAISPVVMMAMVAQADILPVYLVKREKRWKRQIAVIGEKIEYNKCFQSPVPTLDEIRAVKELLVQKEYELE